jgi:hypothetical protein
LLFGCAASAAGSEKLSFLFFLFLFFPFLKMFFGYKRFNQMKTNIKYEIQNKQTAQTKSALAMKRLPPFHACL